MSEAAGTAVHVCKLAAADDVVAPALSHPEDVLRMKGAVEAVPSRNESPLHYIEV